MTDLAAFTARLAQLEARARTDPAAREQWNEYRVLVDRCSYDPETALAIVTGDRRHRGLRETA